MNAGPAADVAAFTKNAADALKNVQVSKDRLMVKYKAPKKIAKAPKYVEGYSSTLGRLGYKLA